MAGPEKHRPSGHGHAPRTHGLRRIIGPRLQIRPKPEDRLEGDLTVSIERESGAAAGIAGATIKGLLAQEANKTTPEATRLPRPACHIPKAGFTSDSLPKAKDIVHRQNLRCEAV